MGNEILTKYHDGFNDCWQFLKQYMTSGDPTDQAYWDSVIRDASTISEKHGNKLITSILIEITNELERVSREKRHEKR